MNKIVYILLAIVSFCVVSCDKIPENGDLDGNWQLLTIEKHNSGEVVSVKEQKVFWAVQLKLIAYKGADNSYLSRFVYDGDSLFLYNFYRQYRRNLLGELRSHIPFYKFKRRKHRPTSSLSTLS